MKFEILDIKDQQIHVKEDTLFVLNTFENKDLLEGEIELILDKSGVEATMLGIYVSDSNKKFKISTISNHLVPNTKCYVNLRAVLLEGGDSSYTGKIIIHKRAQQTVSFLEDNVLVVGENTKNETQPMLEIEADDVKASHGAATGRIDETQLYYLMSRGFSKEDAEKTIISGFFEVLVKQIPDEDLKNKLRSIYV